MSLVVDPYRFARFDPTAYGITWHSLLWAEDPNWTPPSNLAGVSSWTDNQGSHTVSQATSSKQPFYLDRCANFNGKPAVYFPGLLTSSTFTDLAQTYSVIYVGQISNPTRTNSPIASDAKTTSRVLIFQDGTASRKETGFAGGLIAGSTYHYDPQLYRFKGAGASSALAVGSSTVASGNAGTNSLGQIALGNRADWSGSGDATTGVVTLGNYGPCYLFGIVASDVTAASGWTQFLADIQSYLNVGGTKNLVVCDGDSRTVGLGASLARNVPWPAQVDNTLGAPATVINLGVGSQTVADMNTDAATQVDPLYSASTYTKNVVVCAGGINDCLTQTAATIETRLSTYVSGRQATGYKVAICTMPPASTVTGANETTRTTVNSWITGGSSGADVVVDLAADSRLSNTGDTTYFASDGVHFTTTGYGVWASLIRAGLATLSVT